MVECDTSVFQEGDNITVHLSDGEMRVKNDTRDVTVAGASLPPIVQELIRHGGLVPYLAARGSLETSGFAVERSLTVGRLLAKPEVFVVQRYSQSG